MMVRRTSKTTARRLTARVKALTVLLQSIWSMSQVKTTENIVATGTEFVAADACVEVLVGAAAEAIAAEEVPIVRVSTAGPSPSGIRGPAALGVPVLGIIALSVALPAVEDKDERLDDLS